MRKAGVGVSVAGILVARFASAQATQPPVFPAESRLVTVDVLVFDRDGTPVSGLTALDFVVEEDGAPQAIASFEALDPGPRRAPAPLAAGPSDARRPLDPVASNLRSAPRDARTFVLLVDDVSLAPSREAELRRAIHRFAGDGLRDGDELLFATTSGEIWWSARMPDGLEDVRALAARLRGRRLAETTSDYMSEWEAHRIARFESPTGAALESSGVSRGSPSFGTAVAAPATSVTERVVTRWLERFYCDARALDLCRTMVARRAEQVDRARANRTRDVMARIDQAVVALSAQRGRKALLLLTEGFLNDPDLDVTRLVAGRCREANIAVYSLDVRGLLPGFDELSAASSAGAPNAAELSLMRQEQVEFQAAGSVALAEDTGGFALRDTNDLGGGAVRIAEESRAYYLLGIVPPAGKGPRDWRSLRVSVKRPGLTVRARKGYTLRTAADVDRDERKAQAEKRRRAESGGGKDDPPPLELSRALASGIDRTEIPLRAMAFSFEPRPGGRVHALVALEADLGRIANLGGEARPVTVLSLSIAVTHRDSGEIRRVDQQVKVDAGQRGTPFEGWLTLRREFELRPGVNQARVVVRDEFLGRTGAVTARFEVPDPRGLRLSTPILTDRTLPGQPGQPSRPVLVPRRTFGSRGPLYCQYEVFGAAPGRDGGVPRVVASYELRRKDGVTVRQDPPSVVAADAQGRLVRLLRLPVDGLPPGDYELVLRVQDEGSGSVSERTEAFRLEAM